MHAQGREIRKTNPITLQFLEVFLTTTTKKKTTFKKSRECGHFSKKEIYNGHVPINK